MSKILPTVGRQMLNECQILKPPNYFLLAKTNVVRLIFGL